MYVLRVSLQAFQSTERLSATSTGERSLASVRYDVSLQLVLLVETLSAYGADESRYVRVRGPPVLFEAPLVYMIRSACTASVRSVTTVRRRKRHLNGDRRHSFDYKLI